MRVVPIADVAIPERSYAALLVTSGNAVRALENHQDINRLRGIQVFAVGKRTAERARAAGFARVRAADGGASALYALVTTEVAAFLGPLLYAAAEERSADLEGDLRAAGYDVDLVEVYRAEATGDLPADIAGELRACGFGAVLLASRKTAFAFRAALGADPPPGLRLACLAPQIAEPVRDLPRVVIGVAARPDETSLFDVLASWERERLDYGNAACGGGTMAEEKTSGGDKPGKVVPARAARAPTIDLEAKRLPDPASPTAEGETQAVAPAASNHAATPASPADATPPSVAAPATDAAKSVDASAKIDATLETAAGSEPVEPRDAAGALASGPAPAPRSVPWVPALGGGVAGAALVGLGAFALGIMGVGRAPDRTAEIAALTQRLAAAETQVQKVASLEQALARIEPRVVVGERSSGEVGGLAQRVTAQAAETAGLVATLRGEVRGLVEQIAALARAPAAGDGPPAPEALATDVARLRQAFVALDGRVGALDLGPLETRVAELAASVARLSAAPAPVVDRTGALAVAAGALKAALDRGGAFQLELDALRGLGVPADRIAGLSARAGTGVPSAAALADRFRGVARRVLDAAAPASESTLDGVMRSAARIVSVRPTGEVAGADPAAIIARVEARLARGDLAAALTEFRALPETARRAAGSFAEDLAARAEADALIAAVTRDLLQAAPRAN